MKFKRCEKCFYEINGRCEHKHSHLCGFPHNGRASLFLPKMSEFGKNLTMKEEDPMKKSKGGRKYDKGKLLWDLFPFDVAEGVVDILTYGAEKYDPNNWQKVETYRYIAALFRHLVAWLGGEELDQESKKHHLDHALCNLMFIRWQSKHNKIKMRDK